MRSFRAGAKVSGGDTNNISQHPIAYVFVSHLREPSAAASQSQSVYAHKYAHMRIYTYVTMLGVCCIFH